MALHFDLGLVKKQLHFAPMLPPPRLGLLAGPVHSIRVDPVQRQDALFGLAPEPFAQGGLVGALI